MKVLIFFVSSIFLLFNTDNIYTSLNDDPSEISYTQDVDYSATQVVDGEEPSIEDAEGGYISDDNPVTYDEDPNNFPLETPITYDNVDDHEVQSPTHYQKIPAGACAVCGDGTYSFSRNRRGTCSHHGGVSQWLK